MKTQRYTDTEGRLHVKMETKRNPAATSQGSPNFWDHQELEEARKGLPAPRDFTVGRAMPTP